MCISAWSSAVCSSDLVPDQPSRADTGPGVTDRRSEIADLPEGSETLVRTCRAPAGSPASSLDVLARGKPHSKAQGSSPGRGGSRRIRRTKGSAQLAFRSEERRVGQGGVRTIRFLWEPFHLKKKKNYKISR